MGVIVKLLVTVLKYTLFNVFFLLITIPLLLLRVYNKKTVGRLVVQKRLDGKTVIVTGGNVGLGYETAKELAYRGARVLLACKNIGSGHLAKSLIIKETRNDDVAVYRLDLSSLRSVRNFAKDILEKEKSLDVLIFNAGIGLIKHEKTADNLQLTWQVNCFSSFLLSNLLIDFMKKSPSGKIIFVSSALHHFHWFNIDDINSEKTSNAFMNYCNTKFATILMANFMAKKLEESSITVNTVNPGLVNVPLIRRVKSSLIQRIFQKMLNIYGKSVNIFYLFKIVATPGRIVLIVSKVIPIFSGGLNAQKSVKNGAATTLTLVLDPKLQNVTASYFSDCKISRCVSSKTKDFELATALWNKFSKIVNLNEKEKNSVFF